MGMLVPIIFLCLATFANSKLCEKKQFWSSILERCENCSRCVYPDIAIRPCQGYADTVCGPLSELNIDWTWLKNPGTHSGGNSKHKNGQKEMLDTFKENFDQIRQHELHMIEKQRYLKRKQNEEEESDESSEEIEAGDIFVGDRYKLGKGEKERMNRIKSKISSKHKSLEETPSEDQSGRNRNRLEEPLVTLKTWQKLLRSRPGGLHFNDREALELMRINEGKAEVEKENETFDPNHLKFDENGILIRNFGFTKVEEDNVKMEKLVEDSSTFSEEFTTTEKFILDWQTVILGIAVSSCIIFFLVAAVYSVQHAKHWKKLRNYFDADVEELQSWISSKNSESKGPPSGIYKTTTEVVHEEGSQCKYLERIIRMNGKNKFNFVTANVYEKDNNRPSELKPLTKKYPLVHKKGDRI